MAETSEVATVAAETAPAQDQSSPAPTAMAEGERPATLPDDVAVPAGLRGVMQIGGGDGTVGFSGSIPDTDAATAAEALAVVLEADGWTVERQDTGVEMTAGLNAERDGATYAASFTSIGTRVSVQLTYAMG